MDKRQLDSYCALTDAVFEWCLRNALALERCDDREKSAAWALVAARTAADFGHGYLRSAPLESLLGRIADKSAPLRTARAIDPPSNRRRWLHVFSSTWQIGGHTVFGRRWINHNAFGDTHYLVVTDQSASRVVSAVRSAVERSGGGVYSLQEHPSLFARILSGRGQSSLLGRAARLREIAATYQSASRVVSAVRSAVERSGGGVYSLQEHPSLFARILSGRGQSSLLGRAARLREIAATYADIVVLHTHQWDVIPTLAFAQA